MQRSLLLAAAVPVLLLALVFAVQTAVSLSLTYVAPFQKEFNILLNVGFIILSVLVAWGVVKTGRLQLVWMGAGILVLGLAILLANLVGTPISLNTGVQIQNLGALLAASLHFVGALAGFFSVGLLRPGMRQRAIALAAGYGSGIAAISLVVIASAAQLLPAFFVSGEGGTPVRQVVIALAAVLFAASALLLFVQQTRSRSPFLYMYSLALAFLSLAQLGYLSAGSTGDVMTWIGRLGQWGASLYFLLAMLLLLRASRSSRADVHQVLDSVFPPSGEGYRLLIEASPDAIIGLDAEGQVLVWNAAAESILGYGSSEAVGRPLGDLIGVRLPGQQDPEEVFFRRPDGEGVWLAVSVAHGAVRGHPITTVTIRDTTEQKEAEMTLRELHRRLQTANRETNLYLDILTHDIGNTENVSNLYADLLIDSLDGQEADQMRKLKRSIEKSIEILGTVSTIRRIHQAPPGLRAVDLDAAILEALEAFPERSTRYDGAPCRVMADDLLGVVMINLIGNAVKFGGPDAEIAVRADMRDGEVLVSVEDTGPGVPDDEKDEIFHRYEQKRRGVGEGLGLYLVQILVERYGGTVWADDRVAGRPEEGAAFRFTLQKPGDAETDRTETTSLAQ